MRWLSPFLVLLASFIVSKWEKVWGSPIENSLALVFDDGEGNTLPYRLFLPPGHDEPEAAFPLVLFLHGAGDRGTDNLHQVDVHIGGLINATQSEPFASFLVAPQVPEGSDWSAQRELTMKLLANVQNQYGVDVERATVTNSSCPERMPIVPS